MTFENRLHPDRDGPERETREQRGKDRAEENDRGSLRCRRSRTATPRNGPKTCGDIGIFAHVPCPRIGSLRLSFFPYPAYIRNLRTVV
jgi:hypothetical protein